MCAAAAKAWSASPTAKLIFIATLLPKPFMERIGSEHEITLAEWRTLIALDPGQVLSNTEMGEPTGLDAMNRSISPSNHARGGMSATPFKPSATLALHDLKTQIQLRHLGRFTPHQGQQHLRCSFANAGAWCAHRGQRGQHLVAASQVIEAGNRHL